MLAEKRFSELQTVADRKVRARVYWRAFRASGRSFWPGILHVLVPLVLLGLCLFLYSCFEPHSFAALEKDPLLVIVSLGILIPILGMHYGLIYPFLAQAHLRREIRSALALAGIETCHSCGYDLRGAESDVCPECGSRRDYSLRKMEQRWPHGRPPRRRHDVLWWSNLACPWSTVGVLHGAVIALFALKVSGMHAAFEIGIAILVLAVVCSLAGLVARFILIVRYVRRASVTGHTGCPCCGNGLARKDERMICTECGRVFSDWALKRSWRQALGLPKWYARRMGLDEGAAKEVR